jgi:cellulose 1,4-beta-cellobiosidase
MNTARLRYLALVLVVALLATTALACDLGGGPTKPTITITAPTSDAQFEVGEEVNVLSSANDAKGITRVELLVDEVLYRTDSSPSAEGEKSLAMAQTWTAADPGMHTISVIAYNVDGAASEPWAVTIEVVEAGGVVTPPTPTSQGAPAAATNTPPPPGATATTPPPPEDTPEPELPDLVLDALSINPRDPDWGESIQVTVGVLNDGTAASGPYSVLFRYGSGDFDVCEWNQPALPPRNGGTLPPCTVDHVYASYTTEATVDWRGAVDESNEDNNSRQLAMEVGASPPDLHITEIRFTPDPPVQGSSNHVGVKVHNQGGTEAHNFKVIWRSGEPGSVLEWTITSLDPDESAWAEWSYTYIGHGHFNTHAEVDFDGDVDELDEDNNEESRDIDVAPS